MTNEKQLKPEKTNGILAFTCFRFNINEGYRVTHQEYGWTKSSPRKCDMPHSTCLMVIRQRNEYY